MMATQSRPRSATTIVIALLILALGLAIGWIVRGQRAGGDDRATIERTVHDYLLAHPEVLPEAMARLRDSEGRTQLAAIRGEVARPFPGAVLGNPDGSRTLIEFTDYACGYCRQSVADVAALVAADPQLRVVMRELPILSPESAEAARWALAAADQGRYAQFHQALFAIGRPSAATIATAAQSAGLDMARARATIADPRVDEELKRNVGYARTLGFQGTPSWIAGDQVFSGAVGRDKLTQAMKAAAPAG